MKFRPLTGDLKQDLARSKAEQRKLREINGNGKKHKEVQKANGKPE